MSDNESVTSVGTNVYAALGMPDAEGMLLRAQLVTKIADVIDRKDMTRTDAAAIIGMMERELLAMLRGQFRDISERRMMDCLLALGENVTIEVMPAPAGEQARLTVKTRADNSRSPKTKIVAKRVLRESA